jgi:hypothetical protein
MHVHSLLPNYVHVYVFVSQKMYRHIYVGKVYMYVSGKYM